MDNNQNQNVVENFGNIQGFNNPFNLDPDKEDILIERKLEKDAFCPLFAVEEFFGLENEYYSIIYTQPLKESFFHAIESIAFPNATFFQLSSFLCYIIIIMFIVLLCFGLDETKLKKLLQVKLSTLDKLGAFYPKKIKENPLEFYRLLTFHFYHINLTNLLSNIISLISFCSTFEMFVKKHIFLLIFFLTGIFANLSSINFFNEEEIFCGLNNDINGIYGAFLMLFIMNWKECLLIFNQIGRIFTIYSLCLYIILYTIMSIIQTSGNYFMHFLSLVYGAFIFAIITKPIKAEKWKTIVRISSGIIILATSAVSLILFYKKNK